MLCSPTSVRIQHLPSTGTLSPPSRQKAGLEKDVLGQQPFPAEATGLRQRFIYFKESWQTLPSAHLLVHRPSPGRQRHPCLACEGGLSKAALKRRSCDSECDNRLFLFFLNCFYQVFSGSSINVPLYLRITRQQSHMAY